MTTETEIRQRDERSYFGCFLGFWPTRRWAVAFCGSAWIVIGASWLLSNLGWLSDASWEVVVPVLLIGWGAVILKTSAERRD